MQCPRVFSRNEIGAGVLVFMGALALYAINLDRPGHPDELHHVLAARGLLETGEPRIADGIYWRGYLFTRLVAMSFSLFGESIEAARIPSILSIASTAALLFVWLARQTEISTAWLAAGLYATSPFAVDIAQFSRFYAPQVLLVLAATICWYHAMTRAQHIGRRVLFLLIGGGAFAIAFELAETTALAFVAAVVWIAIIVGVRVAKGAYTRGMPYFIALMLTTFIICVGILIFMWYSGVIYKFWEKYRYVQEFNLAAKNKFWIYHFWYSLLYPSLWPMTTVFALIAIMRFRELGMCLTIIFFSGFVLASFAGAKALRYIAFLHPFVFALWGIGLSSVFRKIYKWRAVIVSRLEEAYAAVNVPRTFARLSIFGAAAFVVLANPFWVRTAALLADIQIPPEKPSVYWNRAVEALKPWLARVDVVVTSEELGTLYYLGRYDVAFNLSKRNELPRDQRVDFGIDPRTGRPVIGSVAALEKLWRCKRSGLFISPERRWGRRTSVFPKAAAFIEARMRRIELPAESRVRAYVWERAKAAGDPECASLPVPGRDGSS